MAHSLSAKKRIRQNIKRRALNRAHKSVLKGKLRSVEETFLHGTVDEAEKACRDACRLLDREANRRILHRNAAARSKSRLTRRLNAKKQQAAAT